ncbi:PolC-type DNA polymerase III [Dokdonia sp. Hel_I_53]|uniref:3'-5' exonuclease n=1 Tax=Dokdonia sp. Hel_I_53 TaxID=1566287 RepID=UPI00119C6343|nr:3'-5' exonuclease [Dokdonia sp. Hel_I_53]TVZ52460.1 DNA polymerase-3 subunit epsilon [Dokdonia sp. Hel_I_53]
MPVFKKNKALATPEFWQKYQEAFAVEKSKTGFLGNTLNHLDLQTTRFIVFDTETTGLNYKEDRILSIGGVAVIGNQISVIDSLELLVKQDVYNPETAAIHGILKQGHYKKVSEEKAIQKCLEFIGTGILVGHHIGFDIAIINQALKRNKLGKLKNKILDTEFLYKRLVHPINNQLQEKRYTLDELAESLKIPLQDRHTAAGDALITALIFIKVIKKLNSDGCLKVKHLFRR